jgi:hypothetical protein
VSENLPSPEQTLWKTVWLGKADDDAADGWLPVEGEVRTSQLAVFERKVTIGDASKDSDDYISSWIQGDWSGGGQILDLAEGVEVNRFWWSEAETRFVNQTALPPLVLEKGHAGGSVWPLGDVWSDGTKTFTKFAVCFLDGSLYKIQLYDPATDTWDAAVTTGWKGAPVAKPVTFRGTASITYLVVPLGGAEDTSTSPSTYQSYGLVYITAGGSLSTSVVAYKNTTQESASDETKADGAPKATMLLADEGRLLALDTDGVLWSCANPSGQNWGKLYRPEGQLNDKGALTFDMSHKPKHLVSYMNRNGQPTPMLISDEAAWYLWSQEGANYWVKSHVQYPPHPDFANGVAVWRPGEDLWISAGVDCVRLTSANVIVPMSGPSRDDGLPGERRGIIRDLVPEMSSLFALVEGDSEFGQTQTWVEDGGLYNDDSPYFSAGNTFPSLMAYSGTGWHTLWAPSGTTAVPTWGVVSKLNKGYRLWWGMTDGKSRSIRLRRTFHNPRATIDANVDQYAPEGFIETGRFDAAMRGFNKIASHVVVYMDAARAADPTVAGDTGEVMVIEYRTDTSPTSWKQLGVANTVGKSSFPFSVGSDGFSAGLEFNWIQFRLKFYRGANTYSTPVLDSFVLHFVKIPQNTASFVFTVPLPKRDWMGKTAGEIVRHLNGLLEHGGFIKFVHGVGWDDDGTTTKVYRGKVAGISGADATGEDFSGGRTVNFIALQEEA